MSNGSSQQQQQHYVPADAPMSAHPDGHRIPAFPFRLNTPSSTPPAAPESPVEAHPAPIPSIARVHPADLAPIVSHLQLLCNQWEQTYRAICQMRDALVAPHNAADIEDTLTLGTNISPVKVDYHGKRHLLLYTPATQTINETVDGLGTRTINLTVGWNVVDSPQGAKFSMTSATPVYLRVRYTNEVAPGLK